MKVLFLIFPAMVFWGCSDSKKTTQLVFPAQHATGMPHEVYTNKKVKKLIITPGWQVINEVTMTAQSGTKFKFSIISDSICQLRRLECLVISGQNIRTLPACVYTLPNLKELDLSFNPLFEIDLLLEHLPRMKNLKVLNLLGVNSAMTDSLKVQSAINREQVKLLLTKADLQKLQLDKNQILPVK